MQPRRLRVQRRLPRRIMRGMRLALTLISGGFLGFWCAQAVAQTAAESPPAPPPGDTPAAQPEPPTEPAPAAPAPVAPAPAAPTPAAAEPAPASAPPTAPAAAEPPPAQPAAAPVAEPADSEDEAEVYEPPPPPDPDSDEGGGIPGFSVRVDPFNWLLAGRLGLELEVAAWKFISVELVPVFVTSESPPLFNFGGRDENLTQHSDGLGPISGTSLGVGFWFSGKPLKGMLLRGIFTNYAYDYETRANGLLVDRVGHTEQHLGVTLGSYNRYGAFILGGEIGLSSDLNSEDRCLPENPGCEELQLRAFPSPDPSYYNLNGGFHPIYLEGRFSLGVAID